MGDERDFHSLERFLRGVPAIKPIAKGKYADGNWWFKFQIDIRHELAWRVVQELGCVLNYLSLFERLPAVFMPVSPAPYLNGGPRHYLCWIIESKDPAFKPGSCAKWLASRLPQPVEDVSAWRLCNDE